MHRPRKVSLPTLERKHPHINLKQQPFLKEHIPQRKIERPQNQVLTIKQQPQGQLEPTSGQDKLVDPIQTVFVGRYRRLEVELRKG